VYHSDLITADLHLSISRLNCHYHLWKDLSLPTCEAVSRCCTVAALENYCIDVFIFFSNRDFLVKHQGFEFASDNKHKHEKGCAFEFRSGG
jgi:hypothetical protein